ncbi:MAG TPA: hypothetical protein PLV06_06080 [Bacteroidales bacterium]|nr:hypothetical protein [Bacteroidales bacterium]HPJ58786.1 hypothetical protein [Bacteroidales bacterium]HPR11936.1 hypothetical protein [Bacteroidales bacterium]
MTFKRGPLNRETLNLGTSELIRQAVIEAGFYHYRETGDFTDIELLRYVSSAGKAEWFEYLITTGNFFDSKGKIRKEFRGQFDECVTFAVDHNHVGIARRLFGLGAKVPYYFSDSLFLAIIRNQHELAELLFEQGAKIRLKYRFADCLKQADDNMVKIIEKHRESIMLPLVANSHEVINELIEKRKRNKK